jgi:glycosyltransferase involved in cell wall biosynthesis
VVVKDMQTLPVSVVLVVRNVDRFLGEAIESILSQTFKDFEFIIVDFGSTDRSKDIVLSCAAKDSRILFHEIPTCGLAEARNVGCSRARGRYIAVMDADDVSLPERLMVEVEFMEKHPEVGFLGGASEWIDVAGKSLQKEYFPAENDEIKSALVTHSPFCAPTTLIRKEAFTFVGGYRPAFAPAEDYDLAVRIAEFFQCANLRQVVLRYRIHPYQLTLRKQKEQTLGRLATQISASARKSHNHDPLNGCQEITPELLAGLGITERTLQNALVAHGRNWIRSMFMAREYSTALKAAVEILQSDCKYVDRWRIADMRLAAAHLYWKEARFGRSLITGVHAFATRPIMLGRPVKSLLQRASARTAPREN